MFACRVHTEEHMLCVHTMLFARNIVQVFARSEEHATQVVVSDARTRWASLARACSGAYYGIYDTCE